jgi:hypothetical protein
MTAGAAGVELLLSPQPVMMRASGRAAGTLLKTVRKDTPRPICQTPPLRALSLAWQLVSAAFSFGTLYNIAWLNKSREFFKFFPVRVKLLFGFIVFTGPRLASFLSVAIALESLSARKSLEIGHTV